MCWAQEMEHAGFVTGVSSMPPPRAKDVELGIFWMQIETCVLNVLWAW